MTVEQTAIHLLIGATVTVGSVVATHPPADEATRTDFAKTYLFGIFVGALLAVTLA